MSYILDALKRADAERERGAVPGLHAQPAAMPLPDDPAARPLPPWAWGLGGLVLAAAGMLAWSLWRSDDAPPATAVSQVAADRPGAGSPPAEPRGTLSGMPANNATTLGERDAMAPRDITPPPSARPTRPPSTEAHTESGTPLKAPQASAKPPHPVVATQPATATAPASSEAAPDSSPASLRVYSLHELPDHVRRSLPQLVIGGAMYSENPGSRMLVINSQLFHEGDKLGPDLTLEEIKLKSAVLRYRTWRYGVTY